MLSSLVVDPLNVVVLVLFILVILFTDYRPAWWYTRKTIHGFKNKGRERKVPGPLALPILGTRWLYSVGYYKMDKIHEVYQDLYKQYGPIVKEEALWNFPVISLFAAEDLEKVLRIPSKYPLRPPTEVISIYRKLRPDRYTNTGLVNEQGETWHDLRVALTPALTSAATMQRYLPELNEVVEDFRDLIVRSRDADNVVRCFDQLANRMGLESTCTLILGRRMGFLDNNLSPIAARLSHAIQVQFCASRDTFYGLPLWKIFPTAAYKQLIQSEDMIYEVISEMVDSALKAEQETCETDAVKSVFMSILQAHTLDTRDKKAGIIDFISAGIKTLGNTLVFLLYLIAKNPKAQKRLYEEITRLAPPGTPVTSQVIRDAEYLKACITEGFRVLPTAPTVARILESDMELSGHQVKAGSVILCQTWIAGLQKENFKEPDKFLPERWLSEQCSCKTSQATSQDNSQTSPTSPNKASQSSLLPNECICDIQSSKMKSYLVAPFGVGKRMCPGKRFIQLELQVVLAQLIRQFEIFFEGELDLQFEFLLAPAGKTNFIMKDRN